MATTTKKESQSNGIAVYDGQFAALDKDSDFGALVAENLGGEGLRPTDLHRVTFPRETPVWELSDPTADDGTRIVQELVGVPVRQTVIRQFYLDAYSGGGVAPDCTSPDGVHGYVNSEAGTNSVTLFDGRVVAYGGDCMRCPLNQWESDLKGGRGKACREYRAVMLLQPNAPLPIVLRLPPTQLGAWRAFGLALVEARVALSHAVVGLSIRKKDDNLELIGRLIGVLPPETAQQVGALSQSLLATPAAQALLTGGQDDVPEIDDSELPF